MRSLAGAGLFLLGVYLSLRTIAALYRIVDLWYTIGTAYGKVIRGVVGWGGSTLAIALGLGGGERPAFLLGLSGFLAFYLALFALRHLALRNPAR
jgi:hypothetical protein